MHHYAALNPRDHRSRRETHSRTHEFFSMDADLAQKLSRRIRRIESAESSSETSSINGTATTDEPDSPLSSSSASCDYQRPSVFNPYTEYNEFSRKQIQSLMQTFEK